MAGTTIFVVCVMSIVTAYAPSAGGINCDASDCLTAKGETPSHAIAACGPAWPLDTKLVVPGYGTVRCGDRFGTPLDQYGVDVWMPDRQSALNWGLRQLEICELPHGNPRHNPDRQRSVADLNFSH